jgi:hypothetical protein
VEYEPDPDREQGQSKIEQHITDLPSPLPDKDQGKGYRYCEPGNEEVIPFPAGNPLQHADHICSSPAYVLGLAHCFFRLQEQIERNSR